MEILFRGLRIDGKCWVEGDMCRFAGRHYIIPENQQFRDIEDPDFDSSFIEILHKSVGQYTGLVDKNGKKIFVGDILCNDEYQTWERRGVVKFSHGVFGAEWLSNVKSQSMVGSWGQKHNLRKLDDDIIERQIVIGNIYENPELLTKPS